MLVNVSVFLFFYLFIYFLMSEINAEVLVNVFVFYISEINAEMLVNVSGSLNKWDKCRGVGKCVWFVK